MFLYIKQLIARSNAVSVGIFLSLFAAPPILANDLSGLSPQEVHGLLNQKPDEVLFIDVRDPVEIMFIGSTDLVDANIPFLLVDRATWDSKKNRFRLYRNPEFITEVKAALSAKGLDEDATVITMCRSGSERGLPSAQFLQEHGLTNATFVVNGFQGGSAKDGPYQGMRVLNGWQNSGLPWSAKPNANTIYRLDR